MADFEDWEGMRKLAESIVEECERTGSSPPDEVSWERFRGVLGGTSRFTVRRDGYEVEWSVAGDAAIEGLTGSPSWPDIIADRLVAALSARTANPPVASG